MADESNHDQSPARQANRRPLITTGGGIAIGVSIVLAVILFVSMGRGLNLGGWLITALKIFGDKPALATLIGSIIAFIAAIATVQGSNRRFERQLEEDRQSTRTSRQYEQIQLQHSRDAELADRREAREYERDQRTRSNVAHLLKNATWISSDSLTEGTADAHGLLTSARDTIEALDNFYAEEIGDHRNAALTAHVYARELQAALQANRLWTINERLSNVHIQYSRWISETLFETGADTLRGRPSPEPSFQPDETFRIENERNQEFARKVYDLAKRDRTHPQYKHCDEVLRSTYRLPGDEPKTVTLPPLPPLTDT